MVITLKNALKLSSRSKGVASETLALNGISGRRINVRKMSACSVDVPVVKFAACTR